MAQWTSAPVALTDGCEAKQLQAEMAVCVEHQLATGKMRDKP